MGRSGARLRGACCLLALLAAAGGVSAADEAYEETLFGDWGGRRSAWRAAGYDWQLVYKADLIKRLTSGGRRKLYGLDNVDLRLCVDGGRALGVADGRLLLHVLSNHGSKPALEFNRLPHGIDNIEVPYNGNTTKIFQLYWDQGFLDDRAGLLFGLLDLNSEFYGTESSALFIHPTYGTGADLAGTGRNGPSVFPTASLALRLRYESETGIHGRAAVFDGVPGDPANPHGTHVKLGRGDGTLGIVEVGAGKLEGGRLALGAWRYTARFADLVDVDADGEPMMRRQSGSYLLAEKRLFGREGERRLDAFFRLGHAAGDTVQFDRAIGTGFVAEGFIPGRPEDEFGIAYAEERNSAKWRATQADPPAKERTLEFAYRYRAAPGFVVQPTLQYLINHGTDNRDAHSWYTVVRFELAF